MSENVIELQHIRQAFNGETVIADLNLSIKKGELFVLVGTSGSGKTTTLKMINRLHPQTSGKILINDVDSATIPLRDLRWDMGYVLQQIALFPTMTVAQNIQLIPELQHMNRSELPAMVDSLLSSVDLDPAEYRDRMPSELSGGEQQRIGILRAIAAKPPVVLMDEPFSALDPISRTQLQDLVLTLHEKLHNTIVFVTHDMDEALRLSDRIGIMSHGDLLQVDKPQNIAQNPVNDFVSNFFAASRAKDLYNIYLGRIIMLGYGRQSIDLSDEVMVKMDVEQTLRDAFNVLLTKQAIQVTGEEHEVVGILTPQDIFKFMSEHEND